MGNSPKKIKRKPRTLKTGRYFSIDAKTGDMEPVAGERPNNQSTRSVQKKVYIRLKAIPKRLLRRTTRTFVEGIEHGQKLSENDLHMAHGRSALQIKDTIRQTFNAYRSSRLNLVKQKEIVTEAERFAAGFITTDSEDEPKVRKWARDMLSGKPAEWTSNADKLLARLNKTSGNLIGAHGPTNMEISEHDDNATLKDGKAIAFMQRRQRVMQRLQKKIGMNTAAYQPLKNADGSEKSSTRG